jgi:dihydrofolate reductase
MSNIVYIACSLDVLNSKGIKHLYIDGGKTIQSFLTLDLIDELIITRMPIILGSGIPLFASMEREINFELTSTETLTKDLVKSTYTRKT